MKQRQNARRSTNGVNGLLDRGDDSTLGGHRWPGDAGASSSGMSTTAELSSNFVDVYLVVFGTQADAGETRLDLLKDTRHHHRSDCTNVIDQTLGFAAVRARAREMLEIA